MANQQGTGTTIVDIAPDGTLSQFAQIAATKLPGPCPGGVGLTTALTVLRNGTLSQFAQIAATKLPGPCPGGVGLTTALTVLRSGWVIVGSLPTSDGTSATAQAGCL